MRKPFSVRDLLRRTAEVLGGGVILSRRLSLESDRDTAAMLRQDDGVLVGAQLHKNGECVRAKLRDR